MKGKYFPYRATFVCLREGVPFKKYHHLEKLWEDYVRDFGSNSHLEAETLYFYDDGVLRYLIDLAKTVNIEVRIASIDRSMRHRTIPVYRGIYNFSSIGMAYYILSDFPSCVTLNFKGKYSEEDRKRIQMLTGDDFLSLDYYYSERTSDIYYFGGTQLTIRGRLSTISDILIENGFEAHMHTFIINHGVRDEDITSTIEELL